MLCLPIASSCYNGECNSTGDETQAVLCNKEDRERGQLYGSIVSTNIYLRPLYCKALRVKKKSIQA